MSFWPFSKWLKFFASVTLFLFCVTFFLHSFIPHEHAHDTPSIGLPFVVHSIAEKKIFVALAVSILAFRIVLQYIFLNSLLLRVLCLGAQTLDVFLRDTLRRLFRRGLLHSKAY